MINIMDEVTIDRTLKRLSFEIIETNKEIENVVLVGIKTRGEYIANRVAKLLTKETGKEIKSIPVNISGYRDDKKRTDQKDVLTMNFEGKVVIICDDVFYTGRSIRAAIDAVINHGRPSQIKILCLVDRGHRELPLRLDYIGKNIPTSKSQKVIVRLSEIDNVNEVIVE